MRKPETIKKEIERYEQKINDRIKKGRTRGAGAGGFNRDLGALSHKLKLLNYELEESLKIKQPTFKRK